MAVGGGPATAVEVVVSVPATRGATDEGDVDEDCMEASGTGEVELGVTGGAAGGEIAHVSGGVCGFAIRLTFVAVVVLDA